SCVLYLFFFSSRRRHTRFSRDWSSDVCSSDLVVKIGTNILTARASWEGGLPETSFNGKPIKEGQIDLAFLERMAGQISGLREQRSEERRCRERVYVEVGAGT